MILLIDTGILSEQFRIPVAALLTAVLAAAVFFAACASNESANSAQNIDASPVRSPTSNASAAANSNVAGGENSRSSSDQEIAVGNTEDGVRIELPAQATASFPVEIRVTGPAAPHEIMFVAAGTKAHRPSNAHSSARLNGGDQVLSLHAPYQPGEYELRYVTFPGRGTLLLSIPFRSLKPKAMITANETARAGEPFDVRITGDVSPHTKVNVVRAGSPEGQVGAHAFIKDIGSELSIRIPKLPVKPGEYEIRYMTTVGDAIYSRKRLDIEMVPVG